MKLFDFDNLTNEDIVELACSDENEWIFTFFPNLIQKYHSEFIAIEVAKKVKDDYNIILDECIDYKKLSEEAISTTLYYHPRVAHKLEDFTLDQALNFFISDDENRIKRFFSTKPTLSRLDSDEMSDFYVRLLEKIYEVRISEGEEVLNKIICKVNDLIIGNYDLFFLSIPKFSKNIYSLINECIYNTKIDVSKLDFDNLKILLENGMLEKITIRRLSNNDIGLTKEQLIYILKNGYSTVFAFDPMHTQGLLDNIISNQEVYNIYKENNDISVLSFIDFDFLSVDEQILFFNTSNYYEPRKFKLDTIREIANNPEKLDNQSNSYRSVFRSLYSMQTKKTFEAIKELTETELEQLINHHPVFLRVIACYINDISESLISKYPEILTLSLSLPDYEHIKVFCDKISDDFIYKVASLDNFNGIILNILYNSKNISESTKMYMKLKFG